MTITLRPSQQRVSDERVQIWTSDTLRAWLLPSQPGWGKSYTSIETVKRVMAHEDALDPVLILTTKSNILDDWMPYLAHCGIHKRVSLERSTFHAQQVLENILGAWWVVANVDKVSWVQEFQEVYWFCIIFDEPHEYFTNIHSQRYRAALSLDARYRIGLTATPQKRYPDTLWPILQMLEPGEYE